MLHDLLFLIFLHSYLVYSSKLVIPYNYLLKTFIIEIYKLFLQLCFTADFTSSSLPKSLLPTPFFKYQKGGSKVRTIEGG